MATKNKDTKGKKIKKPATTKNNVLPVWITIAVITVITYIVFAPSLKNDFTNWDDPTYVTDNPLVVNNAVPVKEIFETPVSLNYHPLTILTLAWNYQNGKLNPEGYHLENLLLHLVNTILVFFFIFLLTRRNLLMAGIVALFFGVHPMHVESVAWVSERKDVLYVLFFMAGLITYLQYKMSKKMWWLIVTGALFILSCLSKGMAVVFPVILILIDYLVDTKWGFKSLLNKIPFFIIAIGFGVAAFKIQSHGAIADIQAFTIFQRFMFASYGAIMYVVKLVAPLKLSTFYPYPTLDKNGNIPLIFYLSPVIIVAFIALVYYFLRKEKPVIFGLLFYIVSVALVLQFISVGSAILADRYSYLSYVGLLYIVAYTVNKAWQAKSGILSALKYPLAAIVFISAVIFSFQTYARTQIWKNSATLWTDVIANYPDVQTAWKNRGNYYGQQNAIDNANHDTEKAKYDLEHSMYDYRMLAKMNSKDSKVYSNMGNVYGLKGQGDSALWAYSKAIQLDPANPDAYINRAITYCMANQYGLAFPDYDKALNLDHNLISVYNNRGYAYFAVGKFQESINDYNLYLKFKPDDGSAYYYRALAEKALSRMDDYNRDIQQAKNLGFKVPEG